MNNLFERFDELYSQWSILDKVGKEMQVGRMWQQVNACYNYLFQIYHSRGYLTLDETNFANQLCQVLAGLRAQKMRVNQELTGEMMKHLAKMVLKK